MPWTCWSQDDLCVMWPVLGITESCPHRWKSQELLDRGLRSTCPAKVGSAALTAAPARIAELETEVKVLRKPAAAVEQVVPPRARFGLVAGLAAEDVGVRLACLARACPARGSTTPAPPALLTRAIQRVWLTDQIGAVHEAPLRSRS